jgi:transposase-like protein
MDTRKFTGEFRLSYWSGITRERIESGLSVKAYCENAGIHENTYYYWQKKLREAACGQLAELQAINPPPAGFVEVRAGQPTKRLIAGGKAQSEILIEIAGIRISADSMYPADKIAALLRGIM